MTQGKSDKTLRVLLYDGSRLDASWDYRKTAARGFYSVLESLRSRLNVEEIWLVQRGGSETKVYDPSVNTYNIFSYKDGKEVVESLKPDIILLRDDYEYLARSLLRAGKAKNVPVVVLISVIFYALDQTKRNVKRLIRIRLRGIIAHGSSIVRRYSFLLRTLRSSGYSLRFILRTIRMDVCKPFSSFLITFSFGGADLFLVNSASWKHHLIKNGVKEEKIVIVGECALDPVYEIYTKLRKTPQSKDILFITTAMVEDGVWTREKQDKLVSDIIKEISKLDCNLCMKIHPGESLEHYRQLVGSVNPEIKILHLDDLPTLISQSDTIITYAASTALLDAVLMRKRIIYINAIDANLYKDNFLLAGRVVIECNKVEELNDKILDPNLDLDENAIDIFIEKQVYRFDGNCGLRSAKAIMDLLRTIAEIKSVT